jgi:UDP:flavonoid glycosyltransferase YjiC (YdhE family)
MQSVAQGLDRQHNTENLSTAISIAVSDQEMKEKAAELGSRIRAEEGVSKAIRALEQTFKST